MHSFHSSTTPNSQQGAVLLVALIMLGIMALIGTATINSSYVNKLLIGNQLSRMQVEQIAHNLIEAELNDVDHFLDPGSLVITEPMKDGRTVTITNPSCTRAKEVSGYSLTAPIVPEVTYWIFDVTVTDPVTGASTKMNYGAKFNYTAGLCS